MTNADHEQPSMNPAGAASPQGESEGLPPPPSHGLFRGTGRRKAAVARVRLVPGNGRITVNERELNVYFSEDHERLSVREPLLACHADRHFDAHVLVFGGGHSGQAAAAKLGVARALVAADRRFEPALRDRGYLTRDARVVERKKYGQRKARRRFQFSKR